MRGVIASINVSAGGVPKAPVPSAQVTPLGLDGDRHNDARHHGGPERALCLYSIERIEALASEGHAIAPGTMGENLTLRGIDWDRVAPGACYQLGDRVIIEITRYTTPCANIQEGFRDHRYGRVSQKLHPGWSRVYARVLSPGEIRIGDTVTGLTREKVEGRRGQDPAASLESGPRP
jgi:MOSC domain-containing protein YiiM